MSGRTESLRVEHYQPDGRLDAYLREQFPAASRGVFQRLIDEGHVRVNGRIVKPSHNPKPGETIEIHFPEARPAEAHPEEIPLDILFEDSDLLVLNKPPGIVVHPSAGHLAGTLVNALLHHCRGQLSGIGGVARPGIVHRLDKDTSGCLVVAKNDETHLKLAEQFAGREVEKTYHAIVCGNPAADHGEIRAAIARHPTHRKRMAVIDRGRAAWTSYRVLERLRGACLVEATLHTGRTHQIRVHFRHLGHPLAGDETYGKRATARLKEQTGYEPSRVLLHAWRLSFVHPRTRRRRIFEAKWPADFHDGIISLRTS